MPTLSFTRRGVVAGLAGIAAGLSARPSAAEVWPSRVIRVISPYAPGGVGDTIFRLLTPPIETRIGQKFVLDNRSGASGNIGTGVAIHSPADGYNMLFAATANMAVNQSLFKNMGFDPVAQLDPIVTVADAPLIAVVGAQTGVGSLKEFAAKARANKSKFNYGSPGSGSPTHLAGASFSIGNGDAMQHIAYRGTPPLVLALLAGDVQIAFTTLTPVQEHLKSGKMRALAVMANHRLAGLPDVPNAAEAGYPGLLFGNWWVLSAPKGTDPRIATRLATEFRTTLAAPGMRDRLNEIGHEPMDLGPRESADFVRSEAARYKAVIERTGIQLSME